VHERQSGPAEECWLPGHALWGGGATSLGHADGQANRSFVASGIELQRGRAALAALRCGRGDQRHQRG
jgi:hypothetical protein